MSTLALDAALSSKSGQSDDATPLNDQERQIVARLLSDPFSYPQVFKTWLVAFLEGSDLTLPISSVSGLQSQFGEGTGRIFQLLPAGMVFDYAGGTLPPNTLLCNGQSLLRAGQYARLYSAIGTTWGFADSTHFNVPDLRSRLVVGAGTTNPVGAMDSVTEASRPLGGSHRHTFSDSGAISLAVSGSTTGGGHEHSYTKSGTSSLQQGTAGTFVGYATGTDAGAPVTTGGGAHSHGVTGTASGSNTVSGGTSGSASSVDRACYGVCNKIINY